MTRVGGLLELKKKSHPGSPTKRGIHTQGNLQLAEPRREGIQESLYIWGATREEQMLMRLFRGSLLGEDALLAG